MIPRPRARHDLLLALDAAAREYREIAHAMAALGDLSARASDTLVARGERASSALLAAALRAAGRKAERIDAAELVATDGRHGGAPRPTWPRPAAAPAPDSWACSAGGSFPSCPASSAALPTAA